MKGVVEDIEQWETTNARMRNAWADRIEMEFYGVATVTEATMRAVDVLTEDDQ